MYQSARNRLVKFQIHLFPRKDDNHHHPPPSLKGILTFHASHSAAFIFWTYPVSVNNAHCHQEDSITYHLRDWGLAGPPVWQTDITDKLPQNKFP